MTLDIPRHTQIGKLYKTKLRLLTIIESGPNIALIKLKKLNKPIQDSKKDMHND